MSTGNRQAFPCARPEGPKLQDGYPEYPAEMIPGLTKRELIAAMAMQGLCAHITGPSPVNGESAEVAHARRAVEYADALLAALAEAKPSQEVGRG